MYLFLYLILLMYLIFLSIFLLFNFITSNSIIFFYNSINIDIKNSYINFDSEKKEKVIVVEIWQLLGACDIKAMMPFPSFPQFLSFTIEG